ncbi:class I SAM-dependent methyltransferase [Alicyclobacillus dauci]|uniref:Class I SAM-dependent methyltransferase n=1 Tax=Alicyclobacillus dauci TaxID=1475485 RepID=A0ABY6Z267_9BACL|nr:methyltransferase domain-containing protein [Alicyclobacillus dauci]WAH36311.1 class I SAM-dependent methyltransferase [Alicyclobacillus dauci]
MSQVEKSTGLDLSRIVFIGRTWEEYLLMFNLTKEELVGHEVLDCPSGACSFTANANQYNISTTATDIAYYHQVDDLEQKGFQDIEHTMQSMEHVVNNYNWDFFQSIDGLKRVRTRALTECVSDMKKFGASRYVPTTLPQLPFKDKQFDVTLSAHFLFTYADRLDYDFHIQTLKELFRVTREEIRIFPTVDMECKRYEYMDALIEWIDSQGWTGEEIQVPYEFQKNANTMLKLTIK